ncbi:HIRAN domain-containing protein [Bacillus sp. FJAT-47783]|uniref:HIRAN domain-containing protein n=1 Tax=Bacillus sp. FJAT-47783 TaxID=2922712 RepID=UPI001FAE3D12|nr:HIRAN domain-containing protein [Bacillus sp. FJAT-47783]
MKKVHTLLVVWQDLESRLYYHVGTLSFKDGIYEFSYTNYENGHRTIIEAIEKGYILHPAFPEITKTYQSKKLFPAFDRRLPSPNRSDYEAILSDLGLNENCSKMELLQQTRGRLANDTYSFEQPLRLESNGKLYTSFFVHGMRHRNLPIEWPNWLTLNQPLKLVQEPTNPVDQNAVGIYTDNGKQLGYVPGFYSKAIFSLLEYGAKPQVIVNYINEKSTPNWWLKVDFECGLPSFESKDSREVLLLTK